MFQEYYAGFGFLVSVYYEIFLGLREPIGPNVENKCKNLI
jgi:hypothetical protein